MSAIYANYGSTFSEKTAAKVVIHAKERISTTIDADDETRLSSYTRKLPVLSPGDEYEVGPKLGSGSFGVVYELKSVKSHDTSDQLVLKTLSPMLLREGPETFADCAADFVKEGIILSSLSHPNILSIKAWSSQNGVEEYHNGRHDAFFLVLERLEETLSQKLDTWRTYCNGYPPSSSSTSTSTTSKKGFFSKMVAKNLPRTRRLRQNETLQERSQVVLDLAGAIAYLHEKRIIHRDLKPDNIGFNYDGVLKVLDFDVAKILPKTDKHDTGDDDDDDDAVFHMTQRIGSIRYMSPECAMGRPYNCKTDVYSFGLICYEVLTLERPYDDFTKQHMDDKVFVPNNGSRPSMPNSWSDEMRTLISNCWSDDLVHSRPAMKRVVPQLQTFIPSFVQQQQTQKQHSSKKNKKNMLNRKNHNVGITTTTATKKTTSDKNKNQNNSTTAETMSATNSSFTSSAVVLRHSITSILFPSTVQDDDGYEQHDEHEEKQQRGHHQQELQHKKSRVGSSILERMSAVGVAAAASSSSVLFRNNHDDDNNSKNEDNDLLYDRTIHVSSHFFFVPLNRPKSVKTKTKTKKKKRRNFAANTNRMK